MRLHLKRFEFFSIQVPLHISAGILNPRSPSSFFSIQISMKIFHQKLISIFKKSIRSFFA